MLTIKQQVSHHTFWLTALVAGFSLLLLYMVLSLGRDIEQHSIKQSYYHYADTGNQLNIENIDSLGFSAWKESSTLNFGITAEPQWIKLQLSGNPDDQLLEIDYPMLDDVQLWLRKYESGQYIVLKSYQFGDRFDFKQRPIIHDKFLISLPEDSADIQILLRAQSSGPVKIPLNLWSKQDYIVHVASHRLFLGLFFGYMLAMGLINVFLFITTKNSMFISYAAYVFSFALLIATLHGIGFRFIWPQSPWLQERASIIFGFLMMSFVLVFSSQILDLKKLNKSFYKVFQLLLVIYLSSLIASFILPYSLLIIFFLIFLLFSIPLILFVSLSLSVKGSKTAKYFSAAWLALLIAGLLAAADNFYWINLPIDSSYLLMLGATTETLLLALALGASYSAQRREARISKQEAGKTELLTLQAQDELLQLQKQAQISLQAQVNARTQELEAALSGLSQVNSELKGLSETDALTGLSNRRFFDEKIEAEASRSRRERKPLAIALLDIDHFKKVNDSFGHQCGDDCLVAFADTLRRTVKRPGDLLFRLGGEEFVALLPNTSVEGALALLENFRLAVEALVVETQGNKIRFTVSVGISSRVVGSDDDVAKMLAFADKLLYQAKQSGRNCIKTGNF